MRKATALALIFSLTLFASPAPGARSGGTLNYMAPYGGDLSGLEEQLSEARATGSRQTDRIETLVGGDEPVSPATNEADSEGKNRVLRACRCCRLGG